MKKSNLRATAALQALALMGAGVATAFIAAAPAAAQDYTNVTASGRVVGTNGVPVAGASVTVTSEEQGFSRTTTTDSSGSFTFNQLPPGNYTYAIAAPGFQTLTETGVAINLQNAANEFTIASVGATTTAAAGEDSTITVVGRRRIVDFQANTTGAVINIGELATRVPVARDITSVVLLSPGTASGDTAFGNLPSINGASVSENVYYINGLNITNFRTGLGAVTVPFDFYETVEVKNGGMPAEFGRTTGGFINATTKRGANQYHGSVTFNWQPDGLRKNAPNTFGADNDAAYFERREAIVQLSGPIIKDRLFVYGLYNFRDIKQEFGSTGTANALTPYLNPTTGAAVVPSATTIANSCFVNPQYCKSFADLNRGNLVLQGTGFSRDRSDSPFYGIKVDAIPIDGQRFEFTYFNTSGETLRDTYGNASFTLASGLRYNPNTNNPGGYASSTLFRGGGKNYVGRYTGTITDWLTVSAAYGKNQESDTIESNTPDRPSIVDTRGGTSTSIGNPTANANTAFSERKFYRADADATVNFFGRHHFRGGYDREELFLNNVISANGGGQITYATAGGSGIDPVTGLPTGTQYAINRTFVSGGEFTTENEAFYLQDQWSLLNNRLQLNLGVRMDRFLSRNADGVAFYESGDQFAPRLGFSFDPIGTGRSKLYGSFSRYFLPVAVNTNLRLAGGELDFDAYYLLAGTNPDNSPIYGAPVTTGAGFEPCPGGSPAGTSCVVRNDGSTPGTKNTVASNLKPQSTDEFILGAEHRVGRRLKFGVFGTYTKLNESLEDAGVDQAIVPICVAAGNTDASCRAIYNGVHQYVLINPGSDVVVDLSDPFPNETTARRNVTLSSAALQYPKAKRTYKAITFTADREFDGKWGVGGSYTYSKLKGNIEGGVRSDNGQTDSGLTTAFDLPALVNGTYGYLPNDRRHNLKLYGNYKPFEWLNLGANLQVLSPRQFGCFGRAPISADATPNSAFGRSGLAGRFYGAGSAYCNLDASGNVVRFNNISAPGVIPVVPYPFVNVSPFIADPLNPTGPGIANPAFTPSTLKLVPRGSKFKSDWLYNLNLDVGFKLPTEFDAMLRMSVFNVLNRKAELDFNEVGTNGNPGTPNATYSLPTTYQAPRSVRFQLAVGF
jgi:hypothetical protein